MQTPDERFVIGRIVAVHGLNGDVRVEATTDFPERFKALKAVWLVKPEQSVRYITLTRVAFHTSKNLILLRFEGITSREAAQEQLLGAHLEIEPDEVIELPSDTYFEHDILGLRVFTTDGRDLGKIKDILHTGANDVYVTAKCLIPAIGDVVKEIDIANGRVVIELMRGLLDEDAD